MTDNPAHATIAAEVLAKVKKAVRDKLTIDSKASYSAIRDDSGWLIRLTPKLLEANKKRITEEQLDSAGLHETLKDGFHRAHSLGLVPAKDGEGQKVEGPVGAGLEEVAHAVEVAAKKPKETKAAKAKPTAEQKAAADEAKVKAEQEARQAEAKS